MSDLKCAKCSSTMQKQTQEDITIDVCPSCESVLLEKGELNVLSTGLGGNIEFCSVDEKDYPDIYKKRQCPKCRTPLKKNALLCHSDVIFDVCLECQSFFLDKGEVEDANLVLGKLSEGKHPEEFREYVDGYLVRLDKVLDVSATCYGPFTHLKNICYFKITIFYKSPLNCGLRVLSERWLDKVFQRIPFLKRQDIPVGYPQISKNFLIQGNDPVAVKKLFTRPELNESLQRIHDHRPSMYKGQTRIEVLDNRLVFLEGPLQETASYDMTQDKYEVVKMLLDIVKAIQEDT